MPLENGKSAGTEADGTMSKMYCNLCYQKGNFINPDASLDDMKKTVDEALKKKGWKWPMRLLARMQLPRLERWRN